MNIRRNKQKNRTQDIWIESNKQRNKRQKNFFFFCKFSQKSWAEFTFESVKRKSSFWKEMFLSSRGFQRKKEGTFAWILADYIFVDVSKVIVTKISNILVIKKVRPCLELCCTLKNSNNHHFGVKTQNILC